MRAVESAAARLSGRAAALALATSCAVFTHAAGAKADVVYDDVIRIVNSGGIRGDLAPQVRITAPLGDGIVAPGRGEKGEGRNNGTGFVVNLEIFTRDAKPILVDEATQDPNRPGIRHAERVGRKNEDFPGLFVFFDQDLVKPDGGIIRRNTNLANLFNVAGADDTPGPGITAWAGWHILESFRPDANEVTITAGVVDRAGRIGFDRITVTIDRKLKSGNALTPDPKTFRHDEARSEVGGEGPQVEIIAPRVPSAVTAGDQRGTPNGQTAALTFIQVDVLDIAGAGIAVDEIGKTVTEPEFGPGSIVDATQLGKGRNRNFPGLAFTFDAPLRAPSGALFAAGTNLAPVFNAAGSEIDPATGAVHVTTDWVIGGSIILAPGQDTVTFTAKVTDNAGNAGRAVRRFRVSDTVSGQMLTPAPEGSSAQRS
jgi:hypothetical protein